MSKEETTKNPLEERLGHLEKLIVEVSKKLDGRTKEAKSEEKPSLPTQKTSKEDHEPHEKMSLGTHWKAEDLSLDCPECVKELGRAVKLYKEKSSYHCVDCGFPMGDIKNVKEQEECPECGSHRATTK